MTTRPIYRPLRPLILTLLLALPLVLVACGGEGGGDLDGVMQATPPLEEQLDSAEGAEVEHTPAGPHGGPEGTPDGSARMEDGVQVVEVTVGPMGYEPAQIRLQAGVPARLVFTRTIEGECPSQIQIPAFEVPVTDLPMHEPVAIAFTPEEEGAFAFVCGMDMMRGTLLVQDGPAGAATSGG